jgi:hypothetical protein
MASRATWRMIYLLAGALLIAYAVYAHDVVSGITLLIFILVGALLLVKGLRLK